MKNQSCACTVDTRKTFKTRTDYLDQFKTQFYRHYESLKKTDNKYLELLSAVDRLEFFKIYLKGSPKNCCGCRDKKAEQIITLIDIVAPELRGLVVSEEKNYLQELRLTYGRIDKILRGEHIYSDLK